MNPADNYIMNQTEPFCSMLLHLQLIIENTIPSLDLKFKYKFRFTILKDAHFAT